jgi:hypothetical protein
VENRHKVCREQTYFIAMVSNMVWYGMVWYGKTLFRHASLDQRELLFMRGVTQ